MKKSKLSLGLVTGLIGVMAMTACSDVTSKKDAIVTFKGYNGEDSYTIVTDEMYSQYRDSADGISKFYEQILEVLIRDSFNKGSIGSTALDTKKTLGTIEKEAWDDVSDQKETAEENAKTNGTSYSTEWDAILSSNGVESTDELYQLFIYQKEKTQIEDWYYEKNLDSLKEEYIGVNNTGATVEPQSDYTGEISSRLPYHLRHVLVSVDNDANNYSTGTITSEQAQNLSNVVTKLREGKLTFGEIALSNSSDSGSSAIYGDAGIVTNKASSDGSLTMVDEFQLGIYAYDAISTKKAANQVAAINEGLGLLGDFVSTTDASSTVQEAFKNATNNDLATVPYEVFTSLSEYKDLDKVDGKELYTNDTMIYPRNVLWNKYLNRHSAFLITDETRTYSATPNRADDPDAVGAIDSSLLLSDPSESKCGFRKVSDIVSLADSGLDSNLGVLSDEAGRPIVGVRSQYGIHFIVIQKSIYEFNEEHKQSNASYVSLENYYTTAIPGDEDYPTADGKDAATYVNYINTNTSGYTDRATTVEDAIKGFDSTYDYRLYEYLYKENKSALTFADNLDTKIIDYLEKQRENNKQSQTDGLNRAWEGYIELLEEQSAERSNQSRMVPEGCIFAFTDGLVSEADAAIYKDGGTCYYGSNK